VDKTTPDPALAELARACTEASDLDELRSVARQLVDLAAQRADAEHQLADLIERVDSAQQLANMGDYDWHIASDTNRWSDQLYRIYGHEPQSFNASYERFLSHIHPDDRDRISAIHQNAYATGEPYQMIERVVRPDGETRYLSSNGQVLRDEAGAPIRMRGTCIDITDQVHAEEQREAAAATLAEARMRRQQALEVNDNVVQGLTAAIYASELGDTESSASYLERTLAAARTMMNDWLNPLDGSEVRAGDLVRSTASTLDHPAQEREVPTSTASGTGYRVLIADDYADIRALLRIQLNTLDAFEVVGEAIDGEEAVRLSTELQPDVVLLDLAMPRMDGLQALERIREAVPHVRIVAMSGFAAGAMADKVLAAGASRYIEKGVDMGLVATLKDVLEIA
jgi:PAS domain S-box-containing protein